ncbi:hypothetical protein IDH30_00525 [Pelagibacterales bacterium SAG-MED15]|nr:hypothetical protein [Pelagibacterales bacterium SAG-MED15]
MKFFSYFILSFFLIFPANSDQIYELIKIPNLKLYKIENNGLKYLNPSKPFVAGVGINNVSCSSAKKQNINKQNEQIIKNFNIYKGDFLQKINLKYIVLCKNLKVSEISALGFANPEMKTLIFNINTDEKLLDRVLHHEVFHFIQHGNEDLFNIVNWEKLNDSNFKYQDCSTCTEKLGLNYSNNNNGFLTDYSMSTPYEDMAEVYSFMITNKNLLIKRSKEDAVIEKKIGFIKKYISKLENSIE